jgi:hypothetical protein
MGVVPYISFQGTAVFTQQQNEEGATHLGDQNYQNYQQEQRKSQPLLDLARPNGKKMLTFVNM